MSGEAGTGVFEFFFKRAEGVDPINILSIGSLSLILHTTYFWTLPRTLNQCISELLLAVHINARRLPSYKQHIRLMRSVWHEVLVPCDDVLFLLSM